MPTYSFTFNATNFTVTAGPERKGGRWSAIIHEETKGPYNLVGFNEVFNNDQQLIKYIESLYLISLTKLSAEPEFLTTFTI